MKLAIPKTGSAGPIVTDDQLEVLRNTHRLVNVKLVETNQFGQVFEDIWGGRWRLTPDGQTIDISDAMEKWA